MPNVQFGLFCHMQAGTASYALRLYEAYREKTYLLTFAPNEDSDQTARPRSLIRVVVVRMKKKIVYLAIHNATSFDSDLTARMCRLIQLVAGHTAGVDGSVGCAVWLETRRSRVQPPPRSAIFFRGYWSWNIFYGHSLPSVDSKRAVVGFWRKNVHNTG